MIMGKKRVINLKELVDHERKIRLIHQRPLAIPGGCVPIRVSIIDGSLLVLCPVNRLKDVPKRLAYKVQADFCTADNFEDNSGLITPEGITYFWGTVIG